MIQKFLLIASLFAFGYTGKILADASQQSNAQPKVSQGKTTVWNLPLINQSDNSSWTVDLNEGMGTEGWAEDIAEEDLNAERFPENQSSDPDIVYPGDNSFEDTDMGSNFDAPLMQTLGEK
ncbi:MAG: hypothetical protein JSS34_07160 [Proteobacteria bacterium]|nr:hypothetical protein [Pseudomonadota bacterium]